MPMSENHTVFFVPSMSGRGNSSPLRGLQTKRVMSGSMLTPVSLRSS
uniref:Uncharacterized protein n=1 Tax=Arundo donax TaxID=35708 RepID=A0A0A9AVM0_ARUDO